MALSREGADGKYDSSAEFRREDPARAQFWANLATQRAAENRVNSAYRNWNPDAGLFTSAEAAAEAERQKNAKRASKGKPEEESYVDETSRQIAEFVKMLQDPNYLNSAYGQRIATGAGNAASNAARARGIEGPLAVGGIQGSVANALGGLDMQRQQMLQSALGLKSQQGLNAAEADYQRFLNDYQMKYDRAQQNYANQAGMGSGIGGLIGTGLGALGFAIPGVGAVAGPALMKAGGAIGSGLGGMGAGGFMPPSMPQYGGYRPRGGY